MMCGIVGYVGRRDAAAILVRGLECLEYRGYDSVGVAVQNGHGIAVRKMAGRLPGLRQELLRAPVAGSCGIAHTRWATHGAPTEGNAHPHADCSGEIAVVHNGIIENADELRAGLLSAGHRFVSDTDTEVLAHLIEAASGERLEDRVRAALKSVEGTYGLAVMASTDRDKVVAARRGSPVLIGLGKGELFLASDASAVLDHTRSVVYLDDGDVAVMTPDGYQVTDNAACPQARTVDDIDWDAEAAALGGYPHFMLKEIFEQPDTVQQTLRGRLLPVEGTARLNGLNLTDADWDRVRRIVIIGCGTSWHAALVGRHALEELAGVPVEVDYASEFRYRHPPGLADTLTVVISQSGETADTLEALRMARAAGAKVIGIVNVVGSTIAREADGGVYMHAGPEVGVASTKAFTSALMALYLLALSLGRRRGLSLEQGRAVVKELMEIPARIARALESEPQVRKVASGLAAASSVLFLGRGPQFPVALEGALKLKEISYIHAEGYPAAEMKHGPIALIEEGMPVVVLAPHDTSFPKVLSNMREVKARGASVIAITSEGNSGIAAAADHHIEVPAASPLLAPVLTVIPLQLLAYHVALLRGCDVDRPRNLAKSVTVE